MYVIPKLYGSLVLWTLFNLFSCRCQSTSMEKPKTSKRNLLDNASNLLTNFLSGGRLGDMPTAEGAVSDLFGRPLFFSLYDWFLEVLFSSILCFLWNLIFLYVSCRLYFHIWKSRICFTCWKFLMIWCTDNCFQRI